MPHGWARWRRPGWKDMAGVKTSRFIQALGPIPVVGLFVAPLAVSLLFILPSLVDVTGFVSLFEHPQFWGSLRLTLFTGVISTVLAFILAMVVVVQGTSFDRADNVYMASQAGPMLALPHLAFAIGLGMLIAPTGLLSRLIASFFTGWIEPPQWQTVQDANGIGLIAALVLKETPFIVWAMSGVLSREDVKRAFAGQRSVALSLGHGERSIWLKVLLPQILPRIIWPLVAVFSYGMTVVDMALVIGPAQPPSLANLIWTDLNDGEVLANARGAAGVLVLTGIIAVLLGGAAMLVKSFQPLLHRNYAAPPQNQTAMGLSLPLWTIVKLLYFGVVLILALQSISGHWPFPRLMADQYTFKSWVRLLHDGWPLLTSLILALSTSAAALLACVFWLETKPEKFDRLMLAACALALCLPPLLIALGQYRLFLQLGLTGTASGMFLSHVLPVTAYVFIMLQGPYRGFDPRWRSVSDGVVASSWRFYFRIKLPLLKAPLLGAAAVGFAVSVAQFVSAQLAAAGRFSTLPMEAVTLASGSNRPLFAASALALMVLPLMAFLLASHFSKSRWKPG